MLPQVTRNIASNRLQLAFKRHLDRTDITLTVQASDALTGQWTDLARSGNGAAFTPLVAGVVLIETGTGNVRVVTIDDLFEVTDPAHPKRFMRLEVTAP